MTNIKRTVASEVRIKTRKSKLKFSHRINYNRKLDTEKGKEESPNYSIIDSTQKSVKKAINSSARRFDKTGYRAVIKTKHNIKNIYEKIKIKKFENRNIKNGKKKIKEYRNLSGSKKKVSDKMKRLFVRKNAKKNQKNYQKIITYIKNIYKGTKFLITSIIAGAWIVLIIIIILSMLIFLISSPLGIFFSNEKIDNNKNLQSILVEINKEISEKIQNIKDENAFDDYVISYSKIEWKDILALYSVKSFSTGDQIPVLLTEENIMLLKTIFWDMYNIEYQINDEILAEDDFYIQAIDKTQRVLHIYLNNKSIQEMIAIYNFSEVQEKQLYEMQQIEYESLWDKIILGSGNSVMVEIASSQLGNIGGEDYWKWYGFDSRVEWCAIFVSWVAEQAGYIESGIIPKFSTCQTQGIPWFKMMNQWKEKDYIPAPGDIIFFDWQSDGRADHVGIVETVTDMKIYTIEGNSRDEVKRREYKIADQVIAGYGVPMY